MIKTKTKTNKKVDKFKYLKLVMYTFLICIISVFTTIIVKNSTSSSSTGNIKSKEVNYGKLDVEYLEKNFDKFFAFGSGNLGRLIRLDAIRKSNLISDSDKEILKKYGNDVCNIYLGEKNGIDIVQITQLHKPYKIFTFNSNLDYSFKDMLEIFEEQSQKKIEKEFLYDSDFDDILRKELSGIIVSFKKEGDLYVPYYTMLLDGKMYVVNK